MCPIRQETNQQKRLTVCSRRRAMRLAYWNGAVWAIGNGLASTTLVVYLALELDSPRLGLGISLILAAPNLVGVLRLLAPALIGRLADRKLFCIVTYLCSAVVLAGLPILAAPGRLRSPVASLGALVVLWCLYHLLQYAGTIALWSWLADLVPQRIRGRFIGIRQRWIVAGTAPAMLCAGLFAWGWKQTQPQPTWWMAYAIPAVIGTLFMVAAIVPLLSIPRVAAGQIVRSGATLRSFLAPFVDRRFLGLLAFGCWFSFFNGVTQSAQYFYPARVLGFGLFVMLAMQTGMRLGQLAISPRMGQLADKLGNRPVMAVSLLLVSTGPLFYYFATPANPWWMAGAWVVWIAYAGLNVCLPNLMLKLSPRRSNTPYIATYYAITGLCYAASTIAGGWMYDKYAEPLGSIFYDYCFLYGWTTRSLGVVVLLLMVQRDRGDVRG
jgi:MFS family permease